MNLSERWNKTLSNLKEKAKGLKREVIAIGLAYRDPRTPWYAKVCAALVVAYALSPIDLIPDFVPVIGYLDDLVLVPAGIALTLRLIPAEVMKDARERASADELAGKHQGIWGAILIVTLWVAALAVTGWIIYRLIKH